VTAAFAHRRALLASGFCIQGLALGLFVAFEVPGLGLGHLHYLAVALLALGGGFRFGIAGGICSALLYGLGVLLNPTISTTELLSASTGIRLITYTTVGAVVGWFVDRDRELVARLQILAERDALTGLPNTRAFEAAIGRRLEAGVPFGLLLGDMDQLKTINDTRGHAEGNDAIRQLAELLGRSLGPEDDIARVGGDEFAVLTSLIRGEEASQLCARLESLLASHGPAATFGWAIYPVDGDNALSLYRAADERLYTRKLVRGPRPKAGPLYPVSA
jgi:diguanylate cyclase (GGDEF)-like protein